MENNKEEPRVIASFFCKPTYLVRISVGVTSQSMRTVKRLFDTGAGPELVNKYFIPWNCKQYVKPIKQLQPGTAIHEHANVKGFIPMFVRIKDLRPRAGLCLIENLEVDILLETSLITRCLGRIFSMERKLVSWHSQPISILTSSTRISSQFSGVAFLGNYSPPSKGKEDDKED